MPAILIHAISDTPPRALVSIMQACALAHVSRRTIYHWLAKGKLEYCRTAGGSVRIYADTLLRHDPSPVGRSRIRHATDPAIQITGVLAPLPEDVRKP